MGHFHFSWQHTLQQFELQNEMLIFACNLTIKVQNETHCEYQKNIPIQNLSFNANDMQTVSFMGANKFFMTAIVHFNQSQYLVLFLVFMRSDL